MINTLINAIGKKVERLFIIVWPPIGEDHISQIDISAGLVFENTPNVILQISTDKNDLTSPKVEYVSLPNKCFNWKSFESRMLVWIQGNEELEIDIEYYEVTDVNIFQNIINQKIVDIELLGVNKKCPIGIKVIFDRDFILSTPLTDGNTVETNTFNRYGNLNKIMKLGKLKYFSLKDTFHEK